MKHINPPLDSLTSIAPFDRLPAPELRDLSPHVDHLHLSRGTVIARQGRPARELVVVLAGEVEATRADVVVGRDGGGTTIGADAVLRHGAHDATWTATSDLDVVVVNGPAYRWAAQTALHRAS